MTAVSWIFQKHWHPERSPWARLRALWWIVMRRHETEICGKCGGPVGQVWHVADPVWWERSGFPSDAGVLCIRCFDAQAPGLLWECAVGDWPSCGQSPCPHEGSMMIIAAQRDHYYEEMRRYRDLWYAMPPPPSVLARSFARPENTP